MIKWIYGYSFDDVMTGYRAMSRPFVKTFPVLSEGFQIETELSIHAVDHRWRIKDVPSSTATVPRVPSPNSTQ